MAKLSKSSKSRSMAVSESRSQSRSRSRSRSQSKPKSKRPPQVTHPPPKKPFTLKPKPRSRIEIWLEKNALPKKRYFPRPKSEPTRFQKPGPMKLSDKKRFLKWTKKHSLPKQLTRKLPPQQMQPPCTPKDKKRILPAVIRLSKPRWPRQKYQPPPTPIYPYSPKIHYRKPAHRDKGRPFEYVRLPQWWYHEEVEIDFWRWMRFPISCCALKYKTTCRDEILALPKHYPIKPHCPYPPRDYSPPDRVRMSPRQWCEHLKRLNYLADASFKNTRHCKVLKKMIAVSCCALKNKTACKDAIMASPKNCPSLKQHCQYTPRDCASPDRVRMSSRQWSKHLERLDSLADASFKNTRHYKVLEKMCAKK